MCDYSLEHEHSRPARKGEILFAKCFDEGTVGFTDHESRRMAVCLPEGARISIYAHEMLQRDLELKPIEEATFFKRDKDVEAGHLDSLRFSNGRDIRIHDLEEDTMAIVLEIAALKVSPKHPAHEAAESRERELVTA